MAKLLLVLAFGFFVFNSFADKHVLAETEENWDDSPDWNQAVRKIKELEKIVKIQNERISMLEERPSLSEWKSIVELQETVQIQNDRIVKLETRVSELEAMMTDQKTEAIQKETPGEDSDSKLTAFTPRKNFIRKERLLLQPTTVPAESIAFFAYFSTNNDASSTHQILAFDKVITNIGNAYHPHSGSFLAPRSGVYVFIWTIRLNTNRYHTTELLHDNNVINSIYLNPGSAIDGTVTGTAVVRVNQGEDVLIRTGSLSNDIILSDANGRSSFAGWILM
uniref:Uncharacterized protein LOC111104216 n=1 Tax=Crassostrea virginica TaxID=6565 RepID=A0A8B8ASY2_CRAVI|nr:uncharacterized protein LOC111104216 [Crassostrea virginica]